MAEATAPEAPASIKITIRQSSGDQFEIEIDPASSVLELKQKCAEKISIPAESQRLIFKGRNTKLTAMELVFNHLFHSFRTYSEGRVEVERLQHR